MTYPIPPKDGRPNPSFGYTSELLTEAEIEELKNRDTRDPEEIATDEERKRCAAIVQKYLDGDKIWAGDENAMLKDLLKEIEDGAKTSAQSSD